jgi:hypothetical protein
MKIERFWCVTDPSPLSEIEDICFETTPRSLVTSTIGAYELSTEQVRIMLSMSLYTDEYEARDDAMDRLRRRDAGVIR